MTHALTHARRVLRNSTPRTDDAIIAAADMVMKHGTPCEWWTANELRRAAFKRQGEARDREAWLVQAVTNARQIGEVCLPALDNPRRGAIRAELPRFAALVGFCAAVLTVGLAL